MIEPAIGGFLLTVSWRVPFDCQFSVEGQLVLLGGPCGLEDCALGGGECYCGVLSEIIDRRFEDWPLQHFYQVLQKGSIRSADKRSPENRIGLAYKTGVK